MLKKPIFTGVLLLLLFGAAVGQRIDNYAITAAGSDFQQNNISLSWTLGETINETFSNEHLVLSQGLLQSEQSNGDDLSTSTVHTIQNHVYPNPASHVLTLQTGDANGIYNIYNLTGNLILSGPINTTQQNINVSLLQKGMYLLQVNKNKPIKILIQ